MVLAVYAFLDPKNSIWCLGANPLDDKRREDPVVPFLWQLLKTENKK